MTHRAAGSSRGVPRIWLLPIVLLTAILTLTTAGVFGRSLILDLFAWWPIWLLLAIAVVLVRGRRIGRVRLAGVVPIVVTVVLGVFVFAHVNGWQVNPSAGRHLVGPTGSEYQRAELTAFVSGELRISPGSSFLYEVDPLPGGGEVGLPSAVETTGDSFIGIELQGPSNPGLDRFAGWDVALSDDPIWTLQIAGELDADLTALAVERLEVAGSGVLRLAAAETSTPVSVDGAFTFVVPRDAAVRIVGAARAPSSWQETGSGWRAPGTGPGWVIDVPTGSVIRVFER